MFELLATRDGEEQLIKSTPSFEDATSIVEHMESEGLWPEGFEAVLRDENGRNWMYVDGWDVL